MSDGPYTKTLKTVLEKLNLIEQAIEQRSNVDRNSDKLVKLIFEFQIEKPILVLNNIDIRRLARWLAEHGVMP